MTIRTNPLSRRGVIAGGTALLGIGASTPALADAKRQALVNDSLRTAQKILEVGRLRPLRLRARAPGALRTRTPWTSALILPGHQQAPSRRLAAATGL